MAGFDTKSDASVLDSELKQVMDTAVARVAQIETAAVVEARELLIRSEQDARDAFGSTLERSAQLMTKLEALVDAVTEMSSTLRAEVDQVTGSLRAMRVGLADWPEREEAPPHAEPAEAEPAEPEPAEPEAADEEMSAGDAPTGETDPEVEPSPELVEMFREQITRMRDEGKSRDEAERVLLRFRLGHRFLGMLDEIYSSEVRADARKPGLMGKLRSRS